jgi:LuxR family transcriptional regulator, maltose regulon positive regulatory protein
MVTVGARQDDASVPAIGRLFDAKYLAPRPRAGEVRRDRLVQAARSSACPFVGVTAPAGYGKSTFLAEWAALEDRPVAWVSLDRRDNDPATLLASIAVAYRNAGLGDPDLVGDLGGPGVSVLGRAAPRLAAELRAGPEPFVLMLDDLNELESPACWDVLSVVMMGITEGSQLATASRVEQPHLPRPRVSGDVLEFGIDDLVLDPDGARQIFAAKKVAIDHGRALEVIERTEGWAAGVSLAALIAKESRDQDPVITGEDPYVADYLYNETFRAQPADIQQFLRRTAVLHQLSGPLCDAVLASRGSAKYLRRVESSGLFLVSLDRRRQWYRFHPLFREFLTEELRRSEPEVEETLHRRAAEWYESNDSPMLAVEHLLGTSDQGRVVELVTELAVPTFMSGQLATVQRWYESIGDATIAQYPQLALLNAWEAVLTGNQTRAMHWAAVIDGIPSDRLPTTDAALFESNRAIFHAAMCASGPESMTDDARLGVEQQPVWGDFRDTGIWLHGEARLLCGRPDEAAALFAEAAATAASVGNFDTIPICEAHLAWMAIDRQEWEEAATHLERALAAIEQPRLHDYVFSIPTFSGAARLCVHEGKLDRARQLLTQAMRSRPTATFLVPYHAVRLRMQLAKVYLALSESRPARQLLGEIDEILVQRPLLGALVDEVEQVRDVLKSRAEVVSGTPTLTPAELRVLPYLQTHLTANGIAERLSVSGHTVRAQVQSIYRKFGVSSRDDAVQLAMDVGLLGG